MKLVIFILLCLYVTINADQIMVIPKTPQGFSLGAVNPLLHLEAYYDLACDDSAASYSVFQQVLQKINIKNNTQVKFTAHFLCLPYHFNAFLLTKGLQVIADNCNNTQDIWNYIDFIFQNQQAYFTDATQIYTVYQIAANLTKLVTSNSQFRNYNPTAFNNSLFDPIIAAKTLFSVQYAQYKSVTSTPSYFANGVLIDNADNFSYNDWINFINKYISS